MTGRVVLFGATGYTGRITAEAMVRAGLAPVLAGRSPSGLQALADALAPLAPDPAAEPTTAIADVSDPRSVRALLESGEDVLVSTVGPFTRLGSPAVTAAVDAGAGYVDSTGEPPFVRAVFEEFGPRAGRTGARLLTAFGYDYVPGNLAGALALAAARAAGTPAARLDIGYFVRGTFGVSAGTRASTGAVALAPSFAWRHGTLVTQASGAAVRGFDLDGRRWDALAVGGSEHLALPRLDPGLTDIGVYLGWAGRWTRAASYLAAGMGLAGKVPLLGPGLNAAARAALSRGSNGSGPSAQQRAGGRSDAVAEAFDAVGRPVANVRVQGPSPYDLTGDLLAWAAAMLQVGAHRDVGALGPADAFGLEALERGCADLGLAAVA